MVMINIQFVFAFIGAAIGIIIGILVFGQIVTAVDCPGEVGSQYAGKEVTKAGYYGTETSTDAKWATATSTLKIQGYDECVSAKNTAWTVLGILPITLFFVLFSIFGAFGRQE